MRVCVVLFVAALLLVPASANAEQVKCYSYEDGGTITGSYGNLVDPTNVTGPQTGSKGDVPPLTWTCPGAHSGDRYLHVAEEPHYSTPQAYLAFISGLQDGDIVTASYWGWDDEAADPSPSLRIWAHYSDHTCDGYKGSAGEGIDNTGYTNGIGWEQMSASWEYGVSGTPYEGYASLVIEMRLYSSPTTGEYRTDYWADDVCVTIPDYATVYFPEPSTLALVAFGALCLIRRRR